MNLPSAVVVIIPLTVGAGAPDLEGLIQEAQSAGDLLADEHACDGGDGDACFRLGSNHRYGRISSSDLVKASALYAKGCRLGSNEACEGEGELFEAAGDRNAALNAFRSSCKGKGAKGCFFAAMVLEKLSREKEAVESYKQSCQLGAGVACFNAALLGERTGVLATSELHALRERGCVLGNGTACIKLGVDAWDMNPRDVTAAISFATRACELNVAVGCVMVASTHMEKDKSRAALFLHAACRLGAREACATAGHLYSYVENEFRDDKVGVTNFARGCALGDEDSCLFAAFLLKQERGCTTDCARGVQILERSCSRGGAAACAEAAEAYTSGKHVPTDPALAREYTRQACSGGVSRACNEHAATPANK